MSFATDERRDIGRGSEGMPCGLGIGMMFDSFQSSGIILVRKEELIIPSRAWWCFLGIFMRN